MMADIIGVGHRLRDGTALQVIGISAIDHVDLVTPARQRFADQLYEDRITAEVIRWIKCSYVTESHVMEQYNEPYRSTEIIGLRIYDTEDFGQHKR